MTTSFLSNSSIVANSIATNRLFVPCVPVSASINLVATKALAKQLATSTPELAHTSLDDFTNIQLKKGELRAKVDECAMNQEAMLDVCVLNIEDLFSHLAASLLAQGRVAESMRNQNAQDNAKTSLQLVHDYASAVGLVVTDYCVGGAVQPEMLFEACLKRVKVLQKRWKHNYFQTIELALQMQKDAVFGAVASCLSELCQDGLENQISLEPMPQTQADVLGALATRVNFPFSEEWPQLRERGVVSNRQGNAGNAGNTDGEGGVQ